MGSRSRCICKSTISEVMASHVYSSILTFPYVVTVIRFRQPADSKTKRLAKSLLVVSGRIGKINHCVNSKLHESCP